MMVISGRSWVLSLLLSALALLTLPSPTLAGTPEGDPARDAAKALALEGIAAMDEQRFADALERLAKAEEKFHAPTHLLLMGQCYVGMGRLVDAHEAFTSVLAEEVPNYAPLAFHEAKREAAQEIERIEPQVARVRISLSGTGRAAATVAIDGDQVASDRLQFPIALAAGAHRIEARTAGKPATSQTVTATVGTLQQVTLDLGGDDAEPAPVTPPGQEDAGADGFPVAAVTTLAIGGAVLAAATALGVYTALETSSIKEQCDGDVCPLEQEQAADSAKVTGHLSTALFAVGGVTAATGLGLLLFDLGDSDDSEQPAPVTAHVGPTGLLVRGSF
ncbi:MAG: hypothetical protein JRI55_20095 [Deltaproteobacteria bacterium]|jgi:tetratricopeptide (TPR) repeat protein|nr:hypothetical protein [Deltaproteobacteria bacterium]